jgi:alcohol dehydrogenase class IV
MRFEFATATRILFGEGAVREVAPAMKPWGRRALLVTGRTRERSEPLRMALHAVGVECSTFSATGEPTVELIRRGVEEAHQQRCDVVIALGGGSAIDAGKAIAALLSNPGALMDYLEVVGSGKPLENPAAPFIAVPTTAGTGSEVTRNAVLGVPMPDVAPGFSPASAGAGLKPGATKVATKGVKVSLRSPLMLARLAVVDPELTLGLPPAITAYTGLDALTQLIEAYVSIRANPMTDGFCLEGIECAARSLRRAYHEGRNPGARRDMSLAALLSGLALANAGLGVVHGFAAPLGGRFPAPHGAICAAILPQGMEINLRALRSRLPQSTALGRYQQVARLLTGRANATADDGVRWVREICRELEVPPLAVYGVTEQDVAELIGEAAKASSMKGNPLALTPAELEEVLARSMIGQ